MDAQARVKPRKRIAGSGIQQATSAKRRSVLERLERRRRRQQLAQDDCSGHADALVEQIELSDAVLAQRDERDAAEVSQRSVLDHRLGQLLCAIACDVGPTDAVHNGTENNSPGRRIRGM